MTVLKKGVFVLSIALICLCLSCWRTSSSVPVDKYQEEIARVKEKVRSDPDNLKAVQELGVLYFKSGKYSKSIPVLEKADQLKPYTPRTISYLGLSYEMSRQTDLALATYLKYLQIPLHSPYRKWLNGRHDLLSRQKLKTDIAARLAQKSFTDSLTFSDSLVVVLPFTYHGDNQKYFLLGKGLEKLMIADLSGIEDLNIVDRVKIQALQDEISRQADALENIQNRTTLTGKFFGAKMIVRGGYNTLGEEQIVLDVAYWDLSRNEFPSTTTYADSLENVFKLQKEMVRGVLENMGIRPDPAESDSILKIRTQNLPALIAYSAGLAKEDAGQYKEAVLFYQKAMELEPDLLDCAVKIEENEIIALALKDPDKVASEKEIAEMN